MKFLPILICCFFLYSFLPRESKGQDIHLSKKTCILTTDYSDKNLNEIKQLLLEASKREAVNEIYGQVIKSETIVKDAVLVTDSISASSLGIIRIEGNPIYFNGKNLGEVCSEVEFFVTKEDIGRFKLTEIQINDFCFVASNIPMKDIKKTAFKNVYKEVFRRLGPSLESLPNNSLKKLLFYISTKNEMFKINTESYCFDFTAKYIPFVIENYEFSMKEATAPTKTSNIDGRTEIEGCTDLFTQKVKDPNNYVKYNVLLNEDLIYTNFSCIPIVSQDCKRIAFPCGDLDIGYIAQKDRYFMRYDVGPDGWVDSTWPEQGKWLNKSTLQIYLNSDYRKKRLYIGEYGSLVVGWYKIVFNDFNIIKEVKLLSSPLHSVK